MVLFVAPGVLASPQRELGGKTCGLEEKGSVCCTPQLTLGAHGIILLDCAFGSVAANQEIGVPGIKAIIKDFVSPQRELGCKTRGLAVKGSDCCTPQLTLGAHGIILLIELLDM